MFNILMGIPEMTAFWQSLRQKNKDGTANGNEIKLYKKLGNTLKHLSENPRYPALHSHEITSLSIRYGMKVWESYLENNAPAAGRIFWVYGPNQSDITIIGLEPHPNDKSNAYKKITLSAMGDTISGS